MYVLVHANKFDLFSNSYFFYTRNDSKKKLHIWYMHISWFCIIIHAQYMLEM